MASPALKRQGFSAFMILCALAIAAPVQAQASGQAVPAAEPYHATTMHISAHKGVPHRLAARRMAHRAAAPGRTASRASFQKVVWMPNIPQRFCQSLACPDFIVLGVGY